jgi:hypothetical protein
MKLKMLAPVSLVTILLACSQEVPVTGLALDGATSVIVGATASTYAVSATPINGTGTIEWTLEPKANSGTLSTTASTLTSGKATVDYTPPTTSNLSQITIKAKLKNSDSIVTVKQVDLTLGLTPTVSGIVASFSQGEGILKIQYDSSSTTAVRVGTIKADGSFTVALPDISGNAELNPVFGSTQCSDIKVSDATVKGAFATVGVFDSEVDTMPSGYLTQNTTEEGSGTFSGAARIFVVKDVSAKGTCSTTVEGITRRTTYDLSLRKGWNAINGSISGEGTSTVEYTLAGGDAEKPWTVLASARSFSAR